jgi:hypothetical protein
VKIAGKLSLATKIWADRIFNLMEASNFPYSARSIFFDAILNLFLLHFLFFHGAFYLLADAQRASLYNVAGSPA